MKKYIAIGVITLSFILLIVILISNQVPKTIELTTFEKAYNIVKVEDDENLEIPIYVNYLDTYIVNKDNITSVNINNNDESLKFSLQDIVFSEEAMYVKEQEYYKYVFVLKPIIELQGDFEIEMEKANIEINYVQGITVKMQIGSFSYYSYNNDNTGLTINQLKGLVNTVNDHSRLVAVLIGLNNNHNKEVTIKEIIPLDVNVMCAYSEIRTDITFVYRESINDLLGFRYDLFKIDSENELELKLNKEEKYFIPLIYINDLHLNKLGFLIIYELDGKTYSICIDDFKFYDPIPYTVPRVNNLKYYTYENY